MEKLDKNDKYEFNAGNPKFASTKGRSFGLFVAMFWAFFFAYALSNVLSPYFSHIVSGLLSGITPLLIGIIVAFIFYRLVDVIERIILKNAFTNSPYKFAIKRTISIFVVMVIIVGIMAVVLAILIPKAIEVVTLIMEGNGSGGEKIYNDVINEISNIAQRWFGAEVSQEAIKDIFNKIFEWFLASVVEINNLFALSLNVLSGFINLLLGMLIAILILKDKERISRFSRRYVYTHMKKERADEICVITNNANKLLFNYFICKIIEFAIIFVSLGIAYMILDLKFTWELALIVGLFNFIPYLGIYIGMAVAALITLVFDLVNPTLYMLLATSIICVIEFNLVIPFITSSRLKVSALVVMSSTIIGGAMFGIVGMLVAPPLFALVSVVISGNIALKENHMKYVMELNKAREKNMQDEKEQLGIMPLGDAEKMKEGVENINKIDSSNTLNQNDELQQNEINNTNTNNESNLLKEKKVAKPKENNNNNDAMDSSKTDNTNDNSFKNDEDEYKKQNEIKKFSGTKSSKKTAKNTANTRKTTKNK